MSKFLGQSNRPDVIFVREFGASRPSPGGSRRELRVQGIWPEEIVGIA